MFLKLVDQLYPLLVQDKLPLGTPSNKGLRGELVRDIINEKQIIRSGNFYFFYLQWNLLGKNTNEIPLKKLKQNKREVELAKFVLFLNLVCVYFNRLFRTSQVQS
jgi:hypothetical protein